MTCPLDLVADWHSKFSVGLPDTPTFTEEVCALRISLLQEELLEFTMAHDTSNRLEMLDALCDLQYVLSGAILHLGMRDRVAMYPQARTHISPVQFSSSLIRARASLFSLKLKYLGYLLMLQNVGQIGNLLRELQNILDSMIVVTGFDSVFDAAFMAVHENNMKKLWSWEEVLSAGDNISFSNSWIDGWHIARKLSGKIIKPPSHKKVDLTEFVK